MNENLAESLLLVYLQANTNNAVRGLGRRGEILDDGMADLASSLGKGWYRDAKNVWQYDGRREHAPRDPHAKPTTGFVDGFHQLKRAWYAGPLASGERERSAAGGGARLVDEFHIGVYSTDEDGGCDGTDGEMAIDIVDLGQDGVETLHAQVVSFSPRLLLRYAHLWTLMMQRDAQTSDQVRDCLLELGFVEMTADKKPVKLGWQESGAHVDPNGTITRGEAPHTDGKE